MNIWDILGLFGLVVPWYLILDLWKNKRGRIESIILGLAGVLAWSLYYNFLITTHNISAIKSFLAVYQLYPFLYSFVILIHLVLLPYNALSIFVQDMKTFFAMRRLRRL